MVRLIGLWTTPADVNAFDHDYLGSHMPKLERLTGQTSVKTSRCIDGPYFRITEVQFPSLDQIHAALAEEIGGQVLADARALADKFGLKLDVLVVAEPG